MTENDKKVMNFTKVVSDTKTIPQLKCVQAKNTSYVKYGENNEFPDYLFDLFQHSSQMSSIILQMKNYIIGNGIESNFNLKVVNRKNETFDDFIEKIVLDYLIFGGFCYQIIRNRLGEIAEIYWLDFRFIRVNEDEDKIYYSKEWNKGRRTPKVYDRYIPNTKQPNSVFYYKGKITREVYPEPSYLSCLTSLEISTQISNFHLNNILNGFTPGAIINFCNGSNLPEDVMDEIEESVKEKFCGTENASRILLSFNDDKEHSTTFDRLPDDGMVDKYNNLTETTEKDIFRAFRINKLLMGDASENTGFNKVSYIEAFALYNKTVIQPIQTEIENVINNVLGEGSLHFDEFKIDWSEYGSDENTSEIIE